MVDYAKKNDLLYVNFLNDIEEIGIDFNTDTYDAGLHLNVYGAEKLARYFGKILADKFDFTDYKSNDDVAAHWQDITNQYNEEKKKQEELFKKYGYLKGY